MSAFVEYERAMLKVLIRQKDLQNLFLQLETQDFANPPTRAFFAVCVEFLKTHDTIEPSAILAHYPAQEGELDQIMQTPNNQDPESLIALLKQESHRRALQEMFQEGSKECDSLTRPRDIHAHALQSLEDIGRAYSPCADLIYDGAMDDGDLLGDIILYEEGKLNIIKSGYNELDSLSGGFKPGDQIIIGASTSMGKTAFALNLALQIPLQNPKNGVLFCSLEMTRTAIGLRMVSLLEGIPVKELKDLGNLGPKRKETIKQGMAKRRALPLYTYAGSRDLHTITTAITTAAQQKGVKLVIVDYIQLIETKEEEFNLHTKLSKISSALKACATQNDIVIIALSQVKRAVNEREDRRPLLSDLKESGSIEQDADMVIFLHRDFKYARERIFTEAAKRFGSVKVDKRNHVTSSKYERDAFIQEALQRLEEDHVNGCHQAELIVAKNRDGEVGTAKTWFYPPFMRFSDDPHNLTITPPTHHLTPQQLQEFDRIF
ncbi:DnaB-like helicase C-terminal domain-containing protein [Helicobacter salomonis]|uniref:DnaB-like helicase C-terminal domain-containing protein n=1 Tax=Helicobacter salomonis TaxID=56878 RepID=UPI000CF08F46|nr:DnaB-like helicase C-terminal domain-containing protein [Helicobacter salomonis]